MPKLSEEQQAMRRSRILDAAELCFAENGFHRTSMQDICRRAGISAGALYLYFDSKEALIEGISARNRDDVLSAFARVADVEDMNAGLEMLLRECFLDQPAHKSRLWLEIGAESTRNPRVRETTVHCDCMVRAAMTSMLRRAQERGQIDPLLPIDAVVESMAAMADGLFWRGATLAEFDAETTGRTMLTMIAAVLRSSAGLPRKSGAHDDNPLSETMI